MTDLKKIALLSNVTLDLLVAKLQKKYSVYIPAGFDAWVQEVVDDSSKLYAERFDSIFVLLDGTEFRNCLCNEVIEDKINTWKQAIEYLANKVENVPIFISTIDYSELRIRSVAEHNYSYGIEYNWYMFIDSISKEHNNIYCFDLAELIRDVGRSNFYSNKMWYMGNMPYSRDGLNIICEEIDQLLISTFDPRKKLIVLDLDNTLWGGVIGEDGIEGIILSNHKEGQRYYDFQKALLEMKRRGTLLAICSKNNQNDVDAVFREHKHMVLKNADFVASKINWLDKAINIDEIEKELNISANSFVFVDDNPLERELIKENCQGVTVVDFPEDTSNLIAFAEDIWKKYFRPLRVLQEDIIKTEMYNADAYRQQEKNKSIGIEDFIKRLEISFNMHKVRENELDRVVQLINKTNQFNVTTRRYSMTEVLEILSDHHNNIYVVDTSDKYGSNGIVAVIIVKLGLNIATIDTFLMSCRVMGRKIEHIIMNEILNLYSSLDYVYGEYIQTEKNSPVCCLFENLGFDIVSDENGHKKYKFDMSQYVRKKYTFFKEIIVEE